MTGIELVAAERKRQIQAERFTAEHDAKHKSDELVYAATCYLLNEDDRQFCIDAFWPWDKEWWKPTPDNRIKELVKAGALIAAEIDRLRTLEGRCYNPEEEEHE